MVMKPAVGLFTKPVVPGRRSEIRDHYNEITLQLEEAGEPGRRFDLCVRAYDGGVALRYEFPQQRAMPTFCAELSVTTFWTFPREFSPA